MIVMDIITGFLFAIGLILGAMLGVLWARTTSAARIAKLEADQRAALDRVAFAEQSQQRLSDQFRALSTEALDATSTKLVELADSRLKASERPIRDTLDQLGGRLREIEQIRVADQAALKQQIEGVKLAGEDLRRETAALTTALRKPQVRGQWGEMQLRRAVEVAGMVERCDFDRQITVTSAEGQLRPDLIVHLAGGKHVVVDAKAPLVAFLEATETADETIRAERLLAHARHLKNHVDLLSGKAYWQHFSPTPEFVVLFVPGEAFLSQALETDPALLEYAAAKKVIIASPTTLISVLRTVAYAWTQEALAAHARDVFELGRELYDRLGSLGDHVDRLGRSLSSAVGAYNKTVGSLEGRVLVSARRLRDLKIVEDDLKTPQAVEEAPRVLSAAELVAAAEEDRQLRPLPAPPLDFDKPDDDEYRSVPFTG